VRGILKNGTSQGSKKLAPTFGFLAYLLVCIIGGLLVHRAEIAESRYLSFDFAEGLRLGFVMVLPISLVLGIICLLLDKKIGFLDKIIGFLEKKIGFLEKLAPKEENENK